MKHHQLKVDPGPFEAMLVGVKRADVRDDTDRGFEVGDELWLRETVPNDRTLYTGRSLHRRVIHVQRGYGLPHGIVVLSLDYT